MQPGDGGPPCSPGWEKRFGSILKSLMIFLFPSCSYAFNNTGNCYVAENGHYMAVADLKSCRPVFVNFECIPSE